MRCAWRGAGHVCCVKRAKRGKGQGNALLEESKNRMEMYVDTKKLKGKIAENEMTLGEFAKALGINQSTLYRKMHSGAIGFTIGEMHKTVEVLKMTGAEAGNIFLAEK